MAAPWPRWEYRQEIFQGVELLNSWGDEGWELVTSIGKDGAFLIFKRPLKKVRRSAAADDPDASTTSGSALSTKKKFKELI